MTDEDKPEENAHGMDMSTAQVACQVINELDGVYINPEFIGPEQVAKALKLLSHEGPGMIRSGPFDISLESDEFENSIVYTIYVNGVPDPVYMEVSDEWGDIFRYEEPIKILEEN